METIFKVNDNVFDIHYGWGKVFAIKDNGSTSPVIVTFKDLDEEFECLYTSDGRMELGYPQVLSFTEYTLEGFSQERPKTLPNLGQIVWGRNKISKNWNIGYLTQIIYGSYVIASCPNGLSGWFADEITTTNPYANEQ